MCSCKRKHVAISLSAIAHRQRDSTRASRTVGVEFHRAISPAAREQEIYQRQRWQLDTDVELPISVALLNILCTHDLSPRGIIAKSTVTVPSIY